MRGRLLSLVVLGVVLSVDVRTVTNAHGTTRVQSTRVLHGFTAFPYDLTPEAVDRTYDTVFSDSNLLAVHLDQCVPWAEALAGEPFPEWVQRDWEEVLTRTPETHALYVAFTPTGMDRKTLAPQCGASEGDLGRLPAAFRRARFDDDLVKQAYLEYAKRVVDELNPAFVNIGIELSEMALQYPDLWSQYQPLYFHTYDELKRRYPRLQIGMEFVLQSLMHERVAEMVKPAVNRSDFIGISFYPYGSEFGERLGAPALPSGRDQWRKPLEWLRRYTAKPIAICETGYTTKTIRLKEANMTFPGSEKLQEQFVEDLLDFAVRDGYLFIVWFVAIDYESLVDKLNIGEEKNIWVNTGLYDTDLKPKPAMKHWIAFSKANREAADAPRRVNSATVTLGFDDDSEFRSSPDGTLRVQENPDGVGDILQWDIRYDKDWVLLDRRIDSERLAGAQSVRFRIQSDVEEFVLFRLDERGGETFHAYVPAGKEWREVVLAFEELSVDPSTKSNGKLEPEKIERVWIGDGGAVDGAKGTRTIRFDPLVFSIERP